MTDKPLTESYELQSDDKEIQAMSIMWECLDRRFSFDSHDIESAKRVARWINARVNDLGPPNV